MEEDVRLAGELDVVGLAREGERVEGGRAELLAGGARAERVDDRDLGARFDRRRGGFGEGEGLLGAGDVAVFEGDAGHEAVTLAHPAAVARAHRAGERCGDLAHRLVGATAPEVNAGGDEREMAEPSSSHTRSAR